MFKQINSILKNFKKFLFNHHIEEFEDDELEKYLKSKVIDYEIINDKNKKFIFNKYQFDIKKEIFLYHTTDENSTIGIINTYSIYGLDVNKAAHFEFPLWYRNNAPARYGVTLIFKWKGKQEATYADADHTNTLPNILYHVSAFSSKLNLEQPTYWESRIYPNTSDGLELIGIKRNEYEIIIFNNPIKIRVTEKKNLLN
ncbi:hypothetical protein [Aliarcobacter butzleri]|uniref:hypothetical protein n=1 Tax=Aliarcobacter butzleri TaxID=28197 RepID=UPI0021B1AFCB|nr:hypothetical protein [Aliarcobacter butzleri]MCT7536972.1 hypothetical protein [Aliarcobacter butzleri]MCT7623452.1 hypothetical protein [Aliarcobacter butzleri]